MNEGIEKKMVTIKDLVGEINTLKLALTQNESKSKYNEIVKVILITTHFGFRQLCRSI